jgi:hypothetical protein
MGRRKNLSVAKLFEETYSAGSKSEDNQQRHNVWTKLLGLTAIECSGLQTR